MKNKKYLLRDKTNLETAEQAKTQDEVCDAILSTMRKKLDDIDKMDKNSEEVKECISDLQELLDKLKHESKWTTSELNDFFELDRSNRGSYDMALVG